MKNKYIDVNTKINDSKKSVLSTDRRTLGQKAYILDFLSVQLSDGYWEGDELSDEKESFWRFLDFYTIKNTLYISVRNEKTDGDVHNYFLNKKDFEIVRKVGEILEDCFEEADHVFYRKFSEEEILSLITELKSFGETLEKIAYKENIPYEMVVNINDEMLKEENDNLKKVVMDIRNIIKEGNDDLLLEKIDSYLFDKGYSVYEPYEEKKQYT